ncbi:MAG TPA: hypothetical protein VLH94_03100 [Spirochaetia bacterium]|nr:hypothetical protein [Spirochaetia bacterium]
MISARSIPLFKQMLRSGGKVLVHEQEVQKGSDVRELNNLGLVKASRSVFPAIMLNLPIPLPAPLPDEVVNLLVDVYTSDTGVSIGDAKKRLSLSRIKELKDLGYVQLVTTNGALFLKAVEFK